ncbi:type II toxin-antitoxin system RelE/ParE family toxin [Candidatus Magnetaquicoccus inordinatus]|uniref:type II toxin-antitoxin system RelE/ParE family toxin n=1 Tax=Candidatus Magnetaquicoccus inordinatus TaxID=2496818 RepID=UPI00102C9CDC|nr:type II toxin-antitoxin system RelE/ParE family toxin [Candidatus Magnetaquicoccus inordinatus]
MHIFKTRWFVKFARQEHISDILLCEAVWAAEAGQVDADYGGNVIKQRIAREGAGKSGGYRSIILFRRGDKAFFVYGFPKNDRNNINDFEEKAFKKMADIVFALSDAALADFIRRGTYQEVKCHEQTSTVQKRRDGGDSSDPLRNV